MLSAISNCFCVYFLIIYWGFSSFRYWVQDTSSVEEVCCRILRFLNIIILEVRCYISGCGCLWFHVSIMTVIPWLVISICIKWFKNVWPCSFLNSSLCGELSHLYFTWSVSKSDVLLTACRRVPLGKLIVAQLVIVPECSLLYLQECATGVCP